MKKFLCLVFVLMLTLSAYAQESWDAETCHYTNHTWHFHWNLNEELLWEKAMPDELHTVFGATSQYGLIAFVNIQPFDSEEQSMFDYWENFEAYKNELKYAWGQVKRLTGAIITPIKIEKCRFFGENAVKMVFRSDLYDDVVNETYYGYTYTFHKNGATWMATVKTCAEIWDLVGEDGIKELFIGLGPNAR